MKYWYLIAFFFGHSVFYGQSDSIGTKDPTRPAYPHMNGQTYLEAGLNFQALCNQLSILQIIDLLNDDFLDQTEKEDLTGSITTPLRYGYFREFSLTYRIPPREIFDQITLGQGFRIRNTYLQSARLDKTSLDLIFYGNKPYEDQTLKVGPAAYQSWYYTALDYLFDVRLDTMQSAEIGVGVILGHDHMAYRVGESFLYTAPDGEYLDADLNYSLRDQARESLVLNGLGLALSFNTRFDLSDRKSIGFRMIDIGVMYWNRGYILDVDSTFRFTGARFDNILNITDSLTNNLTDQYKDAFFYEKEGGYLTSLPFFIEADFRIRRKRVIQELRFGADYRFLPGYFPRVFAGVDLMINRNLLMQLEGSSGGYNLYRLDLGVKFRMGYNWEMIASISNLNTLLLPYHPGGAGAFIRLRHRI